MNFEAIPVSEDSSTLNEAINPSDHQTEKSPITNNSFRISGGNRIEIPQFLNAQKPLGEKYKILNYMFCLFLCSDPRSRVSSIKGSDLDIYYKMKSSYISDYNQGNSEHEKSLSFLYLSALKCEYKDNLISDEWKTIGFETNNPRNEFKEGGYFSLLFITYFIKRYREEYQLIVNENNNNPNNKFNVVQCSIAVCFYAKLALDIIDNNGDEYRNRLEIKVISINQFLNLTFFQSRDQNYLFDIIANVVLNSRERVSNIQNTSQTNFNLLYKNSFNDIFYSELNISPDITSEENSIESFD